MNQAQQSNYGTTASSSSTPISSRIAAGSSHNNNNTPSTPLPQTLYCLHGQRKHLEGKHNPKNAFKYAIEIWLSFIAFCYLFLQIFYLLSIYLLLFIYCNEIQFSQILYKMEIYKKWNRKHLNYFFGRFWINFAEQSQSKRQKTAKCKNKKKRNRESYLLWLF